MGLCVPGIDANRRHTFCRQWVIEPDRERSGLEYHALRLRRTFADHFCEKLRVGCTLPAPDTLSVLTTEIEVSFRDTSRPIYCSMVVLRSMLGPGLHREPVLHRIGGQPTHQQSGHIRPYLASAPAITLCSCMGRRQNEEYQLSGPPASPELFNNPRGNLGCVDKVDSQSA